MNHAALTKLIQAHGNAVRWYLARRGLSRSTIDDVAQELWLRLLRLVDDEALDKPRAYLFTMARNILLSRKKRMSEFKEHGSLEDFANELLSDAHTDDIALSAQMRMAVRCAVGQLPPRQQQMLRLYMDGLTYRQIAAEMGLTDRTVMRQLIRAYAALRADRSLEELVR